MYPPSADVQRIRERLDHPVIDTDGHVIEYLPWVRDLVADIAGEDVAVPRISDPGTPPE